MTTMLVVIVRSAAMRRRMLDVSSAASMRSRLDVIVSSVKSMRRTMLDDAMRSAATSMRILDVISAATMTMTMRRRRKIAETEDVLGTMTMRRRRKIAETEDVLGTMRIGVAVIATIVNGGSGGDHFLDFFIVLGF
jgi:hypothetical protein